MPLLDHFHEPLYPRRSWESFHAAWLGFISDALNNDLLPPGYFAEEQTHLGPHIEIDVATFADEAARGAPPGNGQPRAVLAATWAPPAPAHVVAAAFPDSFEVLVFDQGNDYRLVAAVEMVSPGNKDRAETRRAFAVKCGSYLARGVSLVMIDIVTNRRANLHNELVRTLEYPEATRLGPEVELYATAYRPLAQGEANQVHVWTYPLAVGQPLPVVPLALNAALCLPVDLEATYTTAVERRRIG